MGGRRTVKGGKPSAMGSGRTVDTLPRIEFIDR